jgi:plastocyanin
MIKKLGGITLSLLAIFLIFSCGPKVKNTNKNSSSGAAKKAYAATGNEGSITGVIKFDGTPPAPKKIDMSGDAICASSPGEKSTDDTVVTDGKLANVLVYVTGGKLADFSFPAPSEPVVLDQIGCRYHPRVLGIQTGQTLKVTNSDDTNHNIHPTPAKNAEWNQSQAPKGAPIEKKFGNAEVLIPVKCNQHNWMKAHVGVLDHPFFAVTAKDGSFSIKGLPPGTYTLVAWHERGDKGTEKTATITIGPKEAKTQEFTFAVGDVATAGPTHLKVETALILP